MPSLNARQADPINHDAIKDAFTGLVMARGLRDPQGCVRAESRLYDVCLDSGMSFDEPDHVSWAGGVLTKWWAA